MLKIENIQNVYLNGKAATVFSVYELRDNTWIFDYATDVAGHWKKQKQSLQSTVAKTGDGSIWAIGLFNKKPMQVTNLIYCFYQRK